MAGDSQWANVTALLHFETLVDTAKSHGLAVTGNATLSSTQKKFGSTALYLDGTGDWLYTPASAADFNFGTGDFTIECFGYFIAAGQGGYSMILSLRATTSGYLSGDANAVSLSGHSQQGNLFNPNLSIGVAANAMPANVWKHLALVRTSGVLKYFVDGVQVGADVANTKALNPTYLYVGVDNPTNGDGAYNGYIDEVRVTKAARYTANFAPPTAAFVDGLGAVSGTVKDSSNAGAVRTLRAYRRDTGALVGSTTSDAAGNYTIYTPTLDEVSVICLDDAAGTTENDLVMRAVPA